MQFATLVKFSKLVADSLTSESVSSLLAQTVVDKCGASHCLIFGIGANSDFETISSYGQCSAELDGFDLTGIDSVSDLQDAALRACGDAGYEFLSMPLISDAGLFGFLGVLYPRASPLREDQWTFIEALSELTAISLSKTFQYQKLQKAFDDLRSSQDTLVRTEKFRALGEMSAGIAHDLKNLLNPLVLYNDEIRDYATDFPEILDCVQRIDRVLNRGVETVERLRNYSRISPAETEEVRADLNALVREAVEISKAKLASTKLLLELGSPRPVLLRTSDCVTAIVNLIFNAVDAVDTTGKITIRTASSESESWVEVEDNGPGMTAEIKRRILEPLFTTKGSRGTGLGVSSVNTFAQRHRGRLEIESEPGHGARFRIVFPL
jgi:signal transduction histidine kinase